MRIYGILDGLGVLILFTMIFLFLSLLFHRVVSYFVMLISTVIRYVHHLNYLCIAILEMKFGHLDPARAQVFFCLGYYGRYDVLASYVTIFSHKSNKIGAMRIRLLLLY